MQALSDHPVKLAQLSLLNIVRDSGKQNGSQRGDDTHQNALDLHRRIIISHILIRRHKAKHHGVQICIDRGSAGHGEENGHRLHMPHRMIAPNGPHINIFMRVEQIHNVGRGCCKNGDPAINDIVTLLMDQEKHPDQRHQFEDNRSYCNIGVFFQRFIEPLHANRV